MTSKDERDLLEVLKFELHFIEWKGYRRTARTAGAPPEVLQDSPSCINFGDPNRARPCDECQLLQLVPPESRSQNVPCHHIPLNEARETVASLAEQGGSRYVMEVVKSWLRSTIKRLEEGRVKEALALLAGSFSAETIREKLAGAEPISEVDPQAQNHFREHLGHQLKLMRVERHWTLKDLAQASGMSVSQLSAIERGVHLPSLEALLAISRALQKRPSALLSQISC